MRDENKNDMVRIAITVAVLQGLTATSTIQGLAEGIRSPTIGAYGLGISGGRSVWVDDASAVTHQPSNLSELSQWEVAFEPTFAHHEVRYRSPQGDTIDTESPWKFIPHFFAGGPISDRFTLGIGVTVPFGLGVEWEPISNFRYSTPHNVSLRTIQVNPTLSWRICEKFSIAVGVDMMPSEIEFRQYFPWSIAAGVAGLPDGLAVAKADGVGYGANAAFTWKITNRQRLTFGVRAPMDVDYDGDFRLSRVPSAGGQTVKTTFESKIKYPTIITAGYGFELPKNVRLAAQMEWVQYSRFQDLPITVGAPFSFLSTPNRQLGEDIFTLGGGVTWDFAPAWQARASYQHFDAPIPDRTFSPSIPDSEQNVITLGTGFRRGHHRIDAAYSRVWYAGRDIAANQTPAFIGRYEIAVHLFSLAYAYRF